MMEELMIELGTQVQGIKQVFALRPAASDDRCYSALQSLHEMLSSAEHNVVRLQEYLDSEKAEMERGEQLAEMVQAQAQRMRHIETNMPSHLPSAKIPLSQVNGAKADRAGKAGVTVGVKGASVDADVPMIRVVKVEEFEAVPPYIRGRLSRDQVNSCIQVLQGVLVAKYRLLGTPRSTLGAQALKKHSALKDAECEETKGLYFFTEDEIKMFSDFKLDPSARACIAILRATSRLKELRSQGFLRYVVVV